jgi:hypothetical protein
MLYLRRPRTWWSVPAAVIMWAACTSIGHPWLDLMTFILCIGLVFVEAISYPAWIRADVHGVTVWDSFRWRTFPWSEIQGFAVGNPSHPAIAYLIRGHDNEVIPVKLPDLSDPTPTDVVRLLSKRQETLHQRRAAHAT